MNLLRQVKQTVKKVLGRQEQSAVILMYHRVADISTSPYHGIVSVAHFSQQMAYLHQRVRFLPLMELAGALQRRMIPKNSVVVTFDDGYADNFQNALPILAQHQIPATIFLTGEAIDSGKEYWWDELERILILPEQLPRDVHLALGGHVVQCDFWRFDPQQRVQFLRAVHGVLKTLRSDEREALLEALRSVVGAPGGCRPAYRPMSQAEITDAIRTGLVTFGAHTMTHPVLSMLGQEDQRDEIMGSIRQVEAVTGCSVSSFAYPFGTMKDFNSATLDILTNAGIQVAVTTVEERVSLHSDPLQLPRFWVGDWDQTMFAARLGEQFQA
ncbi:MAG: polysaccharide deacetylase family protein [Anaerolineae bacterium]|nr:polysaccharide deacetylase family protein [Anaerolineae bacterium]